MQVCKWVRIADPLFFMNNSFVYYDHEKTHTRLKDEIVPTFLTM
jgi:hypothetical protein